VPGPDVLDCSDPSPPARRGWVVGVLALLALLAPLLLLRPDPGPQDPVAVELVGHNGSALDGQQFLRITFALVAEGGDAELESVAMVLGGARRDAVALEELDEGKRTRVFVDVVPQCPQALQDLPAGTLEVTYRADGVERAASLPLPVEGSLPRLVQRRCSALDRT
jgi:hypothetical protein